MTAYIIRRLLISVLVVLGVVSLVFFMVRLSGEPTLLYLPEDATDQQIADFRERMGFDRPVYVQYGQFMWRLLSQGDLGRSFRHGEPALSLVLSRLPATIQLTAVAFVIAMAVSVPVGIISAVYRNSFLDAGARVFALFGECLPVFWFGILLILLFTVNLGWLPSSGYGEWRHLVLPGIALASNQMAVTMRILRSSMIEVLNDDFIRTARSKGLTEGVIILRHALKNASLPVITVIGLRVGFMLSGAILTEVVFAYPGIGRLAVQAIYQRDFAVVQAFVFVVAIIIVLINLTTDVLYTYLDPRIRYT